MLIYDCFGWGNIYLIIFEKEKNKKTKTNNKRRQDKTKNKKQVSKQDVGIKTGNSKAKLKLSKWHSKAKQK